MFKKIYLIIPLPIFQKKHQSPSTQPSEIFTTSVTASAIRPNPRKKSHINHRNDLYSSLIIYSTEFFQFQLVNSKH